MGLLGGQVQVTMSYETCCVLFLSSTSSRPFWAWLFTCRDTPQRATFQNISFVHDWREMMEGWR
jgi:hypothetical protein